MSTGVPLRVVKTQPLFFPQRTGKQALLMLALVMCAQCRDSHQKDVDRAAAAGRLWMPQFEPGLGIFLVATAFRAVERAKDGEPPRHRG